MKRGDVSQDVVIWMIIAVIAIAIGIALFVIWGGKFPNLVGGAFQ